ncbi:MAG TPA: adenylate/guanylate cyclase domain-containing protein [Actinomycetota bacterium]|nr:adenylate/guanylate cyclase domain-containing protein [Actinomycetota bacterium]
MGSDLPTGTVTFLFTDIEGSTKLLHELGEENYAQVLAEHRRILRDAFSRHEGVEVDTQGDSFFVAFPTAPGALEAAREAQKALLQGPIRVRMGIHTGTPLLTNGQYVGVDVHRAARIAAAGHGGQVLLSASAAVLVGTEGLRDLGEHRLKDLSAPERIFQLGETDFPLLKTLYQTNLPIPATPFLGRDQEVADVVALLKRADVRLLTLTGPGGTGKTRLAAEAAARSSEHYPHGVWWVPLAPLRDPALVLETARGVLGAGGDLARHIRDASMLLLLDNFEQVVEAGPDLGTLLASCPNLALLVTSRQALHVTGEHEYPVPSLARTDAVTLFLTRAHAVKPDFSDDGAVSEICHRLEDLPLAVELAAARVKTLSPRQILDRLEKRLALLTGGAKDLPERQRTLRATIEWSYDLLRPEERRLFARLAVFRGGCTLETAEYVAEADLDALQSLVDKSLLRLRGDRFWMLETIREYAVERLEESGEAEEVRRRHAEHFLALAEESEPHLLRDSIEWLNRLEAELNNIRAVMDRLEDTGNYELVLRLGGALLRFWYLKSHQAEAQRRLERALGASSAETWHRARALHAAAAMAHDLGDRATTRLRIQEAIAIYRKLGDKRGIAWANLSAGLGLEEEGDLKGALSLFEESRQIYRELGDEHFLLLANANLGRVTYELGDRDQGIALHEANVRRARELGNERVEAGVLSQLGTMLGEVGRLEEATAIVGEAIRIEHRRGNVMEVAIGLSRLASVMTLRGLADTAARLLASSQSLTQQLGSRGLPFGSVRRNEETLARLRTQLDASALAQNLEKGKRLTIDDAVALALGEMEEPAVGQEGQR